MGIIIKRALITGVRGQDGAYLAKFLIGKGYKVFGTTRRISTPNFWRLHYLNIFKKIELIPTDITDSFSISHTLEQSNPDEVYHLAAQSFVQTSFTQPTHTMEVTGKGVINMINGIKEFNDKIKFYQAGSSEMFGNNQESIKNEKSQFAPASPYAIAKLAGHWYGKMFREAHGMHVTNGILFNHESPLRGLEFVTRKVTNGVAMISLGITKDLQLGNLSAKRDWGYAPEYVEAMWAMVQQKNGDEYVIATNEEHSIKELVNEACKNAGISTSKIKSNQKHLRPLDVSTLKGNYSKAKNKLKWKPKTKFKNLVKIMVEEDIERWERWQKKEVFPWDAGMAGFDVFTKIR